jgi:hypothetical protein
MITLCRNTNDPNADLIEKRFKTLVLAYQVTIIEDLESPYILEAGQKIVSETEMEKWFLQLEFELQSQRSLSGDGCYIDPNTGAVC